MTAAGSSKNLVWSVNHHVICRLKGLHMRIAADSYQVGPVDLKIYATIEDKKCCVGRIPVQILHITQINLQYSILGIQRIGQSGRHI